ncbi:MAG: nrdD protein [Mailhella sp.]|nr:nrdD protein [Mailhella sp.]
MVHAKAETGEVSTAGQVLVGSGVRFERIRRITGYLVGTLERFNDAKAAEERDRVKHCDMRTMK